jgi:hypothetical protein
LAFAVGQLQRAERLDEAAVPPQQLLEELFAGVQHTLEKLKETVSGYAAFLKQVLRQVLRA